MHGIVTGIWVWLAGHQLVAVVLVVALVLGLWRQPRQTIKLVLAILVLVALGYGVSGVMDFTKSGVGTAERMINKTP